MEKHIRLHYTPFQAQMRIGSTNTNIISIHNSLQFENHNYDYGYLKASCILCSVSQHSGTSICNEHQINHKCICIINVRYNLKSKREQIFKKNCTLITHGKAIIRFQNPDNFVESSDALLVVME